MGTTAVRCAVEDFERARLPAVCAVTGRPAEGWYPETYESRVGAQYLLLLFGLVPFLVVRAVTRKTATGRVPVTQATFTVLHERARRARRRAVTVLGVGGAVTGVGIAVSFASSEVGRIVVPVGLAVVVVGLVLAMRRSFLPGHVEENGRWVVIDDAHPAFAAAVSEQVRLAP